MSEDFLLKWNDHHSLFFVGAEELCEREEYTDVTLAAGTKFFSAHKLVLSICSPYFRRLFKRLGRDKSVIFLKDVDHRHLDLLLQYMYKGEIKVQEDELVAVLNTAQDLEIKGLSENSRNDENFKAAPTHNLKDSSMKRPMPNTENIVDQGLKKKQRIQDREIPDALKPTSTRNPPVAVKPQPFIPQQSDVLKVKEEVTPVTIDLEAPDQGGGDAIQSVGLGQEVSFCQDLATSFDGEDGDVGYGGEFFQEGVEHMGRFDNDAKTLHICPYCQKEFKKMSSLNQHLPVHTKEKNFECNLCNASYTRSSSLYSHIRQKHQSMETPEYQEIIQ